MNLERLLEELDRIVQDKSLYGFFTTWINDAIQTLAMEYDFTALRRLDYLPFTCVSTAWYRPAPGIFLKEIIRCYNSAGSKVTVLKRLEELEAMDWDHDEVANNITHIVAHEQGDQKQFAYYPKANEDVKVWFYERPNVLEKPSDEPHFIPREFRARLILPEVVIKNFELLQDMVKDAPYNSLGYWLKRKQSGLYGSPAGELGYFQWLVKSRGGPRRHGGRNPLP